MWEIMPEELFCLIYIPSVSTQSALKEDNVLTDESAAFRSRC